MVTKCSRCGKILKEDPNDCMCYCRNCGGRITPKGSNSFDKLHSKSNEEEKMSSKKSSTKKPAKVAKPKAEKPVKEKRKTKVERIRELYKTKSPAEIAETIKEEFNCKCSEGYVKATIKYIESKNTQ